MLMAGKCLQIMLATITFYVFHCIVFLEIFCLPEFVNCSDLLISVGSLKINCVHIYTLIKDCIHGKWYLIDVFSVNIYTCVYIGVCVSVCVFVHVGMCISMYV